MRIRILSALLSVILVSCGNDAETPQEPVEQASAEAGKAAVIDTCGKPATRISDIQGRGLASPMLGQSVSIEAVVTAKIERLGGVFVQEEKADRDGEPLTSEALFLLTDPKGVEVGQLVRAEGIVNEIGEDAGTTTAVGELVGLRSCGPLDLPDVTVVEDAPLVTDDWEAFESMRVRFEPELRLIDHFQLTQGSLSVSVEGRLYAPTQLKLPAEAQIQIQDNERAQILLGTEDGRFESLRKLLDGVPTSRKPLRLGARLAGVEGIFDQREGHYRVHVSTAHYFPAERPALPDLENPELVIAGFNLLNLFNGDGKGGEFPTMRGASTAREWQRQLRKSVAALAAMRADVYALNELENDAHNKQSAGSELVRALNNAFAGDYEQVVPPATPLGGDAIRVGMLYRKGRVQLMGPAESLTEAPFDYGHRPPLLQRFKHRKSGEQFAVVVVHFKSKGGCEEADPANIDRDDGQGCFNGARIEAARALKSWLDAILKEEDDKVLLMGDFNAYAMEDPIRLLEESGFSRLGESREYSFVYRGVAGSLDHALVSKALMQHVTESAAWHINTDEMHALDYQMDDPTREPLGDLYRPEPYRSSDHDPLLLGLRFSKK
jgi:hypothetical protein